MKNLQKLNNPLPFFGIIILLNLALANPAFGTEGEKSRSGGGIISSTENTEKDALASFLIANTTWSTEKHLGFEANGTMESGTTGGTTSGSGGGTTSGSTGGTGSGSGGGVFCGGSGQPPAVSATITISTPSCDGNLNRPITAVASNGTAPFTYQWDNADTAASRTVTTAGTFTVTITDASGCTDISSKTLNGNVHTGSTVSETVCGTYTWSQNGMTYTSSGTYTDTLQNRDGCDSILTLNLTVNPIPSGSISEGDSLGFCDPDSLTLSAQGAANTYEWYKQGNEDWNYIHTARFSVLTEGHIDYVTDENGVRYVGFSEKNNGRKATVMKQGTSNWEIVGSAGFSSGQTYVPDMATYNGQPYIAYRDLTNSITVEKFDGTNWVTLGSSQFVSSSGYSFQLVLEIDTSGTPYIAFTDSSNSYLSVMKFNGSTWNYVGSQGISGSAAEFFDLYLDGSTPYVAFKDNQSKATVMSFNGTNWTTVSQLNETTDHLDLEIDNGNIYLAFDESPGLTVQKFDGSNWASVGQSRFVAGFLQDPSSSIFDFILKEGSPYVAYKTNSNSKVEVMKFNGSSWQVVGSQGFSGFTSDFPVLSFQGETVSVAFREGSASDKNISVMKIQEDPISLQAHLTIGATGKYYLVATNAPGCSSSDTITIIENGVTTVNLYDSTSSSYTWSRNGLTYDTTGQYSFLKTDTTTCDSLFILNLTVTVPPTIYSTVSDSACGSYTWAQNGMTYTSSGSYQDTVSSASGGDSIIITLNLTIYDVPLISITAQTDVSCNGGNDGSFTAMANGGTAPYTYNWSSGDTSAIASFLSAGVYTVTATDANGCSATLADTILEPSMLGNAIFSVGNVSCRGGSDGFINYAERGGTAPYQFLWSNGDTTANISGLTAGAYTVSVTDANNCGPSTRTITIGQPSTLSMQKTFHKNVSCNGGNDGSLRVLASGGTGSSTYLWSNGDTSVISSFLSAGVYTVTATDANGCTTTLTDTVFQPTAMNVSINAQTNVSCNNGNNGSATVAATGGTSPYTYNWSNGDTSATASFLSAGTYAVTVTDANNCVAVKDSITITEPTPMNGSSLGVASVKCNGGSDGFILYTQQGGTSPYQYLWSNGDTTANISGLSAGSYTITVTDANGCGPYTRTAVVTQPAALSLVLNTQTNLICKDGNNGAATVSASGGTTPYTFNWSNGDTSATASFLSAGMYTVTVTDANNCSTVKDSITITEPALITGSETITTCDSFMWSANSTVYMASGTFIDTLVAANGCDSVVTLNLSILNSTSQSFTADICNSYDWQGMTFTASGTYYDTIPNVAGCDSLMTLNLIIRYETSETFTADVCNSYDWQGMTFTTSGTYYDTIPNAAGCDSLMTLNLTIRYETSEAFTADVCNSYDWQGMTFTQSGTYYDTIPNAAGCDSLMTLNLTIRYETSETFTADVCNSYDWQGMTFTQSGTYYDTIPNAAGCDSLMTLNLIIRYETSETFTADVCNSYDWQGMTFTQSGTYYDTVPNAAGCDSLMTLNLNIRYETSETFTADVCNSYDWQGMTFTQSGTYYDTIPNAAGCDSLMTLNLTIRNETSESFTADVCNSYDWQGMTFTTSGTYYDTIPNASGCDSLMTLNLTIRYETSETFTADVCNSYDWQGMTFTQSGTYYDTIPNAAGCDSLMTLNLTIRYETSETFTADVCNSYDWQGMTFTTSGTYYDTIPNAAGCDSLMTLNLTIRNESSETFTADVCNSYDWQGMTFTTSGTYYDTIPNAAGCDSLMTLNLTIRYETSETFTADVCNSYDWQGMTFTTNGTYYDTIPNAAGCDSLMTLNLTIRYETSETFTADVCNSYDWQGMTFTQSGTYYDTIPNVAGCDSLMTLNLTIRYETSETFTADVCNSYDWQGMTFTQSGTYYDTIPNAAGCDSLMTLNLTIRNESNETFTANVCNSYDWQGMTLTTSGTYYDTIPNAAGCDSLMTLNLIVNYTKRDTTTIIACDAYTWAANGQTYSVSGIYSDTLSGGATSGCDSITTLDLSIDEIVVAEAGNDQQFCEVFETTLDATPLSVGSGSWTSIAGSGNFSNASDATTNVSGMQLGTNSFEWTVVNGVCPAEKDTVHIVVNKNPIADAGPDLETRDIEPVQIQATAVDAATISWTPFFSLADATVEQPIANPQENTIYRMEVTSPEGCTSSDEMEITVNVVMKLDATTLFSPNGDGMNDTWVVNKPELIQGCKLIIVNRNGTEVYSTNQYNNEWDGTISGTQLPEGTYYYVFDCPDGRTLKGPITILRERR